MESTGTRLTHVELPITMDHTTALFYKERPKQKSETTPQIQTSRLKAKSQYFDLRLWENNFTSSASLLTAFFPQQKYHVSSYNGTFWIASFGSIKIIPSPFHKNCLRVVCSKCNIQLCLGWKRSQVTYFK